MFGKMLKIDFHFLNHKIIEWFVKQVKQSGLKSNADGHLETTSFKDVLMQFAKLSQNERQDLLQTAMKPPPYSEVTVHPVPPSHTQSSSNSLLHGILTKVIFLIFVEGWENCPNTS